MKKESFENYESSVRYYCRNISDVFEYAKGSKMIAENGKQFIDFFSAAGSLNYGHNNEYIKGKLLDYIAGDYIVQSLDIYTTCKRGFIDNLNEILLRPKKYQYKVQFCGPTGTNAVESALKLARKVTGRSGVFSFMGGFHGVSLGSLAVTSNRSKRFASGIPLNNTTFIPYDNYYVEGFDSIEYIQKILEDDHSGIDKPAAIIFETVQAEGGVNISSIDWMQRLSDLCKRYGVLLICDDIQVGCGRTGSFFSFERAGIIPDIIVLSKSISGYGLPMSILLIKPELDIWEPSEDSGTFRGNQLSFVGASAALEYWIINRLDQEVKRKEKIVRKKLEQGLCNQSDSISVRGIGLIWGIDLSKLQISNISSQVIRQCYKNGLVLESVGRSNSVIKILPALTIEDNLLETGLDIIVSVLKDIV